MREREARTEDCTLVRDRLLEAADAHRRAPAAALRHVAHCAGCRAFRRDLETQKASLAVLDPGLLLLGFSAAGGLGKALAWKGAAAKAGAAAAGVAVTAGVVVLGTQVFGPGDPAPQAVRSPAVPQGRLAAHAPLPAGTAVVVQRLKIAAGAGARPAALLTCPAGLRVADLLPPRGAALRVAYTGGTTIGVSRTARVALTGPALTRARTVTVSVLCRRPTGAGSLRAADQRSRVRPTHRVIAGETFLRATPGGAVTGAVRRGQPVAVRRARGTWRQVISDAGARGWVPAGALRALRTGG